jgi:hypothetical protein
MDSGNVALFSLHSTQNSLKGFLQAGIITDCSDKIEGIFCVVSARMTVQGIEMAWL